MCFFKWQQYCCACPVGEDCLVRKEGIHTMHYMGGNWHIRKEEPPFVLQGGVMMCQTEIDRQIKSGQRPLSADFSRCERVVLEGNDRHKTPLFRGICAKCQDCPVPGSKRRSTKKLSEKEPPEELEEPAQKEPTKNEATKEEPSKEASHTEGW